MINEQEVFDMYVNQNLSTYIIAEKLGTYPNKIRRILKKLGVPLKDKSEAQKLAIETGRSEHPTKGKKRESEVKRKISESVYKNWQNISPENRQKRVDKSKDQWYNMTELEREALRKSAALAVREASVNGSKMENFLRDELNKMGYQVLFHQVGLIPNDTMEIDLFLPELNIAIEIDGPAHFEAIWGEENLQKHIKSDAQKSGLLLMQGFVVVRVKHLTKNLSEKHKRDVLDQLVALVQKVAKKFPSKNKRYIELEVK